MIEFKAPEGFKYIQKDIGELPFEGICLTDEDTISNYILITNEEAEKYIIKEDEEL